MCSNDGNSDYSSSDSDHSDLWEDEDNLHTPSLPYDVSKLEANLYYFGIRGPRYRGPKLIYRTSKDVFTPPPGPGGDLRLMQLLPVYEHNKLGKGNLWATIRSGVVKLLDRVNIQHSSIDLVRFSWVEQDKDIKDIKVDEDDQDTGNDQDIDIKDVPHGTVVTTPVTIWVGVLPDTLTGKVAFYSSHEILGLLMEHGISDVEVAYRESVVRDFSGPELFAPTSDNDPFRAFVEPVTTALSLSICGLKTLTSQGTMGFYFRVDEGLYAVTARHVLFHEDEGNGPYSYVAGPKKQVVLMGTDAFNKFYSDIEDRINALKEILDDVLPKHIKTFTNRLERGGPEVQVAAAGLANTSRNLDETRTKLEAFEKLFAEIQKEWSQPKDRVIGHVVWAPPISFPTAPHGYTKDVCVIKLDEKKFLRNFMGNVLDLGTDISRDRFKKLMSKFEYPAGGLLKLRGILSAEDIRAPNITDSRDLRVRYVIKRGASSLTTVGCMTGFESHTRHYNTIGTRDSVEVAVLPYGKALAPFSVRGDSGSVIVDAHGKFIALLTSGAGPSDTSDITFGSPMYWLWDVIKAQFPGANLYFKD